MKIAVLGSGKIGGTLGKKWAQAGHEVCFGVRDPQKGEVKALVATPGGKIRAAGIAQAIDFGEAVLFAIPGANVDETISANAKVLDGRLIVDAANKFGSQVMHNMAAFAASTPHAKVFRAFNIYGWENFAEASLSGQAGDLFFCGPDGEPRAQMEKLISDVGLNPVYVGGPEQVDVVDGVLRLWYTLVSQRKMGRRLMFKTLV
jgi:8-hydroxy-5-deazaflavin:NADPH oxidoreductase